MPESFYVGQRVIMQAFGWSGAGQVVRMTSGEGMVVVLPDEEGAKSISFTRRADGYYRVRDSAGRECTLRTDLFALGDDSG